MTRQSRAKRISEKNLQLRKSLWPDVLEESLWNRKTKKGFTTIPRTMSHVLQIMNDLSSGKPLASTYLILWCHTYDEYIVTIPNPRVMAFEAGFTGQRAEATWRDRMRKLVELGFIKAEPGPSGPYNYVLILNPYMTIKELHAQKSISRDRYNALFQRAVEIGADDLLLNNLAIAEHII